MKHNYISQSIAEVEYVIVTMNYSNIIWIKKLLESMKEEIIDQVVIYFDSTSSINISKNPIIHTKKKHITIKYHYLREFIQDK